MEEGLNVCVCVCARARESVSAQPALAQLPAERGRGRDGGRERARQSACPFTLHLDPTPKPQNLAWCAGVAVGRVHIKKLSALLSKPPTAKTPMGSSLNGDNGRQRLNSNRESADAEPSRPTV